MIPEDIYSKIIKLMPIACVDLLVEDKQGRVLLLRRANEPAKNEWWFPGGRIHFLEQREVAATRILSEECGLVVKSFIELGTYDVIMMSIDHKYQAHGISTLFYTRIEGKNNFILDSQHTGGDWRLLDEWLELPMHSFILKGLTKFKIYRQSNN